MRQKRGGSGDMPAPLDLSSKAFGRLIAIWPIRGSRSKRGGWLCWCVCGHTTTVITQHLSHGPTRSCGCLEIENRQKIAGVYRPAKPVVLRCPGCGVAMTAHPNRKYCSARCKARIAKGWSEPRHCRLCGGEYRLKSRQTTKREWCSPECKQALRSQYQYHRRNGTIDDQAAATQAALNERLK